jgi:hypothetical protein
MKISERKLVSFFT